MSAAKPGTSKIVSRSSNGSLTFRFQFVAVGLVLWLELEVLMSRAQKHIAGYS